MFCSRHHPDQSGLNRATDVSQQLSAERIELLTLWLDTGGERLRPLSVDAIIESCLILMVLLLLTCARHLTVDCTALKSPIDPVTISCRGQEVALCLPDCSAPLRQLLLSCLPSVIRSVTSPVIHPCACESWLFVLKQPGGSLSPFCSSKEKESEPHWSDFPLGAS